MKKIAAKIDLLKIPGSAVAQSPQTGRWEVVIDIAEAGIFRGKSGAEYLDIDVVEKREEDKFGNTHFVALTQKKEQRIAGEKTIYIGDGKLFEFQSREQPQPARQPQPQPQRQQAAYQPQPWQNQASKWQNPTPENGDDIPF